MWRVDRSGGPALPLPPVSRTCKTGSFLMKRLLLLIVVSLLGPGPAGGQVPQLLSLQGRISVNGTNFGSPAAREGAFKFALVNQAGTVSHWSNDETSAAGSEPASSVRITVSNGHYSVLLGDATLPNMAVLSAAVFTNEEVYVRTWFDGGNGFERLVPDRRIAAVGYAMMAAEVEDGSITTAKLVNGAVTGSKIAPDTVDGSHVVDESISSLDLSPDSVGRVHLVGGAVGSDEVAPEAIGSSEVADGAIRNEDVEDNTITGEKLADVLELGSIDADGALTLWNQGGDVETIELLGGASRITAYGSDGQVQAQLDGPNWGRLQLYDNTPQNNNLVTLAGHERIPILGSDVPGGVLRLSTAAGVRSELKASETGGGYLRLHQNDEEIGVQLEGDNGGAGFISVRDSGGNSRITLDGESTGTGGQISVLDDDGTQTIELLGAETATGGGRIRVRSAVGTNAAELSEDPTEGGGELLLYNAEGQRAVVIEAQEVASNGSQINLYDNAGNKTMELDAEYGQGGPSRVTTGTVEITGGSDLSEQFEVSSSGMEPEPGMIVCIDPSAPGQLKPSSKAYDRTVAGIISGAGGVRTGLLMGQRDSLADGAFPIALTGRVYCRVEASNGAIEPGDLITTSGTPGFGMKVTDYDQARGAIIGKAMTRLGEGQGLVLVLVSLQ